MEQGPKIETSTETASRLLDVLRAQTSIETSGHIKSVMEGMLSAAEAAIVDPQNSTARDEAIRALESGDNYLGEKYRDTAAERAYLKAVNETIEYLRTCK